MHKRPDQIARSKPQADSEELARSFDGYPREVGEAAVPEEALLLARAGIRPPLPKRALLFSLQAQRGPEERLDLSVDPEKARKQKRGSVSFPEEEAETEQDKPRDLDS